MCVNDNVKTNLKKSWKYIKSAKMNLVGYGAVSILEAIISAILPLLSAKVILNITNEAINQSVISALVVFFIEIILYGMYYFKSFFYRIIYQKTLINIQKSLAKENATMKEIRETCINDYIMSLPDKYNTMVGENGVI